MTGDQPSQTTAAEHRRFDRLAAEVSIYPAGLLSDIKRRRFGPSVRYVIRQARKRNWRAVKNWFNGYLAEPECWPTGVRRCGSGWTKRRALRSWDRQVQKAVRRG